MANPKELSCWKCGGSLDYLLLPLSRTANCKKCNASIHVCKMCKFYDIRVAKSCREPVAVEVKEKQRANFCDYLELNPEAYIPKDTGTAQAAQTELDSLFGIDNTTGNDSHEVKTEVEKSKEKLNEIFKLEKDE